jgi:hypothetical protein
MRELLALLLLPLALILGCPGDDDDDSTVGDDDDDATADLDGDLVFTDAHSYSYTGELMVDVVDLGAGQDAELSWDQLTVDVRGGAIDGPEDIHSAALVGFMLTQEEVLEAIATNTLMQSDVGDYRTFDNSGGVSSAMLSDFAIIGNAFDPAADFLVRDTDWTWAVTLWSDMPNGRNDIRTVMFLRPMEDSETHEAAFTDATATLDFQVDLHSADTLPTAPGLTYTLDWSAVTRDSFGNELNPASVDRLLVGNAPGATLEEAEAGFLQYFDQSDDIYRLEVFGTTSSSLDGAVDLDGDTFPGFTDDGIWLVGLESLASTSPAPLVMGVVEVMVQ